MSRISGSLWGVRYLKIGIQAHRGGRDVVYTLSNQLGPQKDRYSKLNES